MPNYYIYKNKYKMVKHIQYNFNFIKKGTHLPEDYKEMQKNIHTQFMGL